MPEVQMPRLSDTMEEGVLSQWLKSEGDEVRAGDILGEIETDKATMELEAYDTGVLERLLVAEGATVPIGQPIAVIRGPNEAPRSDADQAEAAPGQTGTAEPAKAAPAKAAPAKAEAATGEPATRERATGDGAARTTAASPAPTGSEPTRVPAQRPTGEPIRTSPLARRIARDHGIDLASVTGTGPGGRIVRADVEAAVRTAGQPAAESAPAPAAAPATTVAQPSEDTEAIPLTNVRRVTARRLTESATVPHFYLTSVLDAEPLLAFRAEVNRRLAETGTKVSVNDLLIRACATTLRAHPGVNASWGEDKILRHRRVHVGMAVAVEEGLMVPVIRDADRKSVGEIGIEARDLATRARNRKLTPDEFTGSTFSVSNLGMYGIDHFTAIINPPEAAILAVGAATEEPVVRDGQVVAGTTMKLTLSIDHRVLDGATASEFLRDLKSILEEPLRIVI